MHIIRNFCAYICIQESTAKSFCILAYRRACHDGIMSWNPSRHLSPPLYIVRWFLPTCDCNALLNVKGYFHKILGFSTCSQDSGILISTGLTWTIVVRSGKDPDKAICHVLHQDQALQWWFAIISYWNKAPHKSRMNECDEINIVLRIPLNSNLWMSHNRVEDTLSEFHLEEDCWQEQHLSV